jgi:phosphate-selective porin
VTGKFLVPSLLLALIQPAFAADLPTHPAGEPIAAESPAPTEPKPIPAKWYDRINLRGYTQFRFNRIGNPDALLVSPQGDKAIGGSNGFSIRRARLVFSGDITENISIYIQPDLASTPDYASSGQNATNFLQLRDLYGDIFLDPAKQFRFRLGQSKVPFGFENVQSSQNRLALDRNDALNSAVRDERELGVFFYWTPAEIRHRFKYLVDSGLKGSGDYGVFGLGIYNGQNANRPDQNRNLHSVARLTYPYQFGNGQVVEASLQAYTGRFTVATAPISGFATSITGGEFKDERWAASLIVYPQPFGFQAEYTAGRGPRLNGALNAVEVGDLQGGYAQVMYKYNNLIPFVRTQYYKGGRKHDVNAIYQDLRETEIGVEWEPIKALELTGTYTWTDRNVKDAPFGRISGNLIRLQAQLNY